MSKKEQVLILLKKQWVTPLDSWRLIGLHALGQRCSELKREGRNVVSERVPGQAFHRYRVIGE